MQHVIIVSTAVSGIAVQNADNGYATRGYFGPFACSLVLHAV